MNGVGSRYCQYVRNGLNLWNILRQKPETYRRAVRSPSRRCSTKRWHVAPRAAFAAWDLHVLRGVHTLATVRRPLWQPVLLVLVLSQVAGHLLHHVEVSEPWVTGGSSRHCAWAGGGTDSGHRTWSGPSTSDRVVHRLVDVVGRAVKRLRLVPPYWPMGLCLIKARGVSLRVRPRRLLPCPCGRRCVPWGASPSCGASQAFLKHGKAAWLLHDAWLQPDVVGDTRGHDDVASIPAWSSQFNTASVRGREDGLRGGRGLYGHRGSSSGQMRCFESLGRNKGDWGSGLERSWSGAFMQVESVHVKVDPISWTYLRSSGGRPRGYWWHHMILCGRGPKILFRASPCQFFIASQW